MPAGKISADSRPWLARILIVTALVYSPSLRNEFVFDDWSRIVQNRFLGNWSFVWRSLVNDSWWFFDPLHLPQSSYYRPLSDLWLALNFRLFGLEPAGWHAATIALHLLVVWLVFRVAALLAGDRWTGLIAAALFALMPCHAEAVVWATAIPQPLSAAFELGAFEFYLPRSSWWGTLAGGGCFKPLGRGRRILSLGLFGGALLAYEGAVTFPILIAAHSFIYPLSRSFAGEGKHAVFWRARVRFRAALAAMWPYALAVIAYLGVRLWVLGFISSPNPANSLRGFEIALTIPSVIAKDAGLLLIPWRAGPAHHLEFVRSLAASGFYLPMTELAALCGAAFLLLRSHPHRRLCLFCAAWILVTLAPALNLSGLLADASVQDRYLYFPSFGFCVMAAGLALDFARASEWKAKAVGIAAAAAAIVYAVTLFHVQRFWHDDVTLFTRCTQAAPQAWHWHNALGRALAARGDLAGARREFERAHTLAPDEVANLYNMGLVDERLGDFRAAGRALAARLAQLKHPSAAAYAELAFVADAAADRAGTEAALKRAAALPYGSEIVALARAQIRFRHGDRKGAADATAELLRHAPDDAYALAALGSELFAEHRYAEAIAPLRRAARIAPGAPGLHYQLAVALHNLGRESEARDECAIVLDATPNDQAAQALMAALEHGGAIR